MFEDKRSKKVILVAHCVINQNAKLDRCAHYPGALMEVVSTLLGSGVGIIQMPCPELVCLGLDRGVEIGANPSVEEEDTRIGARMRRSDAQRVCRKLADDIVYQIDEYKRNGFEILGLVGINGSPTCAVESTWSDGGEKTGPGVFVQLLTERLEKRSITLPMKGIKAVEPEKAVAAVRELLSKPSALSL